MTVIYTYVIIGLLIISFTSCLYFIYALGKNIEHQSNVLFLSKEETSKFLQEDRDRYVQNMSSADLYARKAANASEYIAKIQNLSLNFSEQEKQKLQRCCKKADEFFRNFSYQDMNCNIISKIRWKLALTSNGYEEGLPHTREDLIFLSRNIINDVIAADKNDHLLVSTLIHEKVHVFQRHHPDIMKKIIDRMGYVEISNGLLPKLKRCNPDLNNKIYMTKDDKQILMILYKSDKPSGINDIKPVKSFASEHPYEKMAYEIASNYDKSRWKDVSI